MSLVPSHDSVLAVPTEATIEPDEPNVPDLQRRLKFIIALGIAGLALMAWLWINSSGTSDQIDKLIETNKAQQILIDKLATQLDAARAQGASVPSPEVVAAATPGADVSPIEAPVPGAPGERGDAGPPGEPGAAGVGVTGDVGAQGATGSKGDTGAQGSTGSTGDTGAAGSAGSNGSQGVAGPAGAQGDPGPAGSQGDPGVAGPKGDPGDTGPKGDPGQYPSVQHYNFPQGPYTCIETGAGTGIFNCNPD